MLQAASLFQEQCIRPWCSYHYKSHCGHIAIVILGAESRTQFKFWRVCQAILATTMILLYLLCLCKLLMSCSACFALSIFYIRNFLLVCNSSMYWIVIAKPKHTSVFLENASNDASNLHFIGKPKQYSVLVHYCIFNDIDFKKTDCHPFAWL